MANKANFKHAQNYYSKLLQFYLGLFAAIGIASCSTPFEVRPQPYSTGPSQVEYIEGLKSRLARSPNTAVRVIHVHGMKVTDDDFSRSMQESYARLLGLEKTEERIIVKIERGYDVQFAAYGQPLGRLDEADFDTRARLRRTTWTDKAGVAKLIAYEVFWAPARDKVKLDYIECFEARRPSGLGAERCQRILERSGLPNRGRRVLFNGQIDDGIMVNGLSDATIVLGEAGRVLQDDFELSFCLIANDIAYTEAIKGNTRSGRVAERTTFRALDEKKNERCEVTSKADGEKRSDLIMLLSDVPTTIISDSLGSFLVLDAFMRDRFGDADTRAGQVETELAEFALMDNANIYMMANQVALLGLARFQAVCVPTRNTNQDWKCPNLRLNSLQISSSSDSSSARLLPSVTATNTRLIAFNDSNDLLGFELPQWIMETGIFRQVINVTVSNPGFTLPGIYMDPAAAHTNQAKNARIIEALVDGFKMPETRKR